jgi:hypothetical protein
VTSTQRTPELVTREIEREREQLALAVAHLRTDLREVANIGAIVRAKLPKIAAGAVVAAGALTALRVIRRRHHKPVALARLGRYTIVEHD